MEILKQYCLSPAAGKRLIARAFALIPQIDLALKSKTVVIIAGTTNGYVAEELLKTVGQEKDFSRKRFFRGVTLPHRYRLDETGRINDEERFPGDVVISRGKWEKGRTIYDAVEELDKGDIIIKGANAFNPQSGQAAVYIGSLNAGTISVALSVAIGRRVSIFVPVGLEKRVFVDIPKAAALINSENASGLRYFPFCGRIISELEAVMILTGAKAELVAAGGVGGQEGCCWLAVSGTKSQISLMDKTYNEVCSERAFEL